MSMPSSTPNEALHARRYEDKTQHRCISCLWPDSGEPVDNGPLHTIVETATHFGISEAQVKAAETSAFRKIKNNPEFINLVESWRGANA